MANIEQRLKTLELGTVRVPVCIFRSDGKIDAAAQAQIERAKLEGREVRFIDFAVIGGVKNGND